MKAKFVFQDKKSSKFWNIETKGKKLTTTFGKLGTDGRSSVKEFQTTSEVAKEAEKLILSKTKKGYLPADGSSVGSDAKVVKKKKTTKGSSKPQSKPAKKPKSKGTPPSLALGDYHIELTYQNDKDLLHFCLLYTSDAADE